MPASAEFPRRQRLTQPSEFSRVFARSARSSDEFFTVLGRTNSCHMPRLGLTVSRKVAKRAVVRNRLKRVAREVFRCQERLPDWDFVVLARAQAAAQNNDALRESLERHFQRLAQRATAQRDG